MTDVLHNPLALSALILVLLLPFTHAATPTLGPTAPMSIASAEAWATMKPCAQGCFIDNSLYSSWPCNMKGPEQWDLGLELSCGCSPQNFCFCNKNDAAKASAYISSCVNKGCQDSPAELTSAIQLYDGYCKTANVAVAVTTSETMVQSSVTEEAQATLPSTTQLRSASTNSAEKENVVSATLSSGVKETSSSTPSATAGGGGNQKAKGLTQSDIVALSVGLGVGVPSLLLALGTFCLARRNHRRNHAANMEAKQPYVRQY